MHGNARFKAQGYGDTGKRKRTRRPLSGSVVVDVDPLEMDVRCPRNSYKRPSKGVQVGVSEGTERRSVYEKLRQRALIDQIDPTRFKAGSQKDPAD